MPPSESSILSSYLLNPASFPTIVSQEQFRDFFPKPHRTHPMVKQLYRDLQFLRTVDMDAVEDNIHHEVIKGERQKLAMYKAYHAGQRDLIDGVQHREIDMDIQLFGQVSHLPTKRLLHNRESLFHSMERACQVLEQQAQGIEAEAEAIRQNLSSIVGELSDLRYGKFARVSGREQNVAEEVVMALESLQEVCKRHGGREASSK
ncbi:MAG: hypothetical protein Q9227_002626 [Pyrenula ochraceoflavens]